MKTWWRFGEKPSAPPAGRSAAKAARPLPSNPNAEIDEGIGDSPGTHYDGPKNAR